MKYLIAGLGNIGSDYKNTRHNIGFQVVDTLAENAGVSFESSRHADKTSFRFKGRIFILIKPATYMNLSGKAIKYWLDKEKIPAENLLVITDDLALDFGVLRLRTKGGDGGHNGLQNIIEMIGSSLFARLRFGIGNDFPKGHQSDYVLSRWSDEENKNIIQPIKTAAEIIKSFGTSGVVNTMNQYNKRQKQNKNEENN